MASVFDRAEDLAVRWNGVVDLTALFDRDEAIFFTVDHHDRHGEVSCGVSRTNGGGPHAATAPSTAFDRKGIDRRERTEAFVEGLGRVADGSIKRGESGGTGEGCPAFGVAGGCLEGDGSALGDSKEEGGLIREAEGDLSIVQDLLDELALVFSEGGNGRRVVAMAGEVGDDAAEAGGAKSFADREVIFFPPGVAVEENYRAADFTPRRRADAAFSQAIAELFGFGGFARLVGRKHHQAGRGRRTSEGGDGKPVVRGVGEDLAVVFLKSAPRRRDQPFRAIPTDANQGGEDEHA